MSPPSENEAQVAIRYAEAADAEAIRTAIGRDVPPPPPSEADPCDRLWLARDTAHPAVLGLVGLRMSGPHAGEIHDLWVTPARRGEGIGVRLVQACLGYCRDHGVLKTLLEVEEGQTEAIGLFEKVGFLLARTRRAPAGERLEFYMDLYRDENASGG